MGDATFLTRVVIENYKSIAACDVRLGPLTFLVGPNGAGKSNFLDAIQFVGDALSVSLTHALEQRMNIDHLLHRSSAKPSAHFAIRLEFKLPSGNTGHYRLQIGLNDLGFGEIQEEECFLLEGGDVDAGPFFSVSPEGVKTNESGPLSPLAKDRLFLASAAVWPRYREVHEALGRMRRYNPDPESICTFLSNDVGAFLNYRGSNITNLVAHLERHNDEARERLREYLTLILPGLREIDTAEAGPGRMLRFWQQPMPGHLSQPFWATQMSHGTLRACAILVALLQTHVQDGSRPSLVALEDVEASIHPAVLGVLRDAMIEASYTTQVLATTQSSDLLDNKEVQTDWVLAVGVDRGQTLIGPIDEASRSVLRDRLVTVGELLRIGQLFPHQLAASGANSVSAVRLTGGQS